jgi:hypothetical protein
MRTTGTNRCRHLPNGVTVIFLRYRGRVKQCLVNTRDYPKIKNFHWTAMWAPDAKTFYAVTKHSVLLHRLLLPEAVLGEHRNHNGLDDRTYNPKTGEGNLRPSSSRNNARNSRKRLHTSSRYKGVYLDKRRHQWIARIQGDGYRRIYLGAFESEQLAAKKYDIMARAVFKKLRLFEFRFQKLQTASAVMPAQRAVLEGHRFGRLWIMRFVGVKDRHAWFEARCDCEKIVIGRGSELTAGTRRKCGSDCTFKPPVVGFRVTTIGHRGTVQDYFDGANKEVDTP